MNVIYQIMLLLDDKELNGILAQVEVFAEAKRGKGQETPETGASAG